MLTKEFVLADILKVMGSVKNNPQYKAANNALKSKMLYMAIARHFAFKAAPLPEGNDVILSNHYNMAVKPLWMDVANEVNELEPINYDLVLELSRSLYMERVRLLNGDVHLEVMEALVKKATYISGDNRKYLEEAIDAFERS